MTNSSGQVAYAFDHNPATSCLFYTHQYFDNGSGEYVWDPAQTAHHGYGFDEYPGGFISIKLPRRIYPTKIIISEDGAQYPKSFRIYASNDSFVNSKVLLHESVDISLNTMDTIWPETGASIKGITIDVNDIKQYYYNGSNPAPGTVNYDDCYDMFVIIVQKTSSTYFYLAEFSVRGQAICMPTATEYCNACSVGFQPVIMSPINFPTLPAMSNLELASWATATSSTNRYRSNNSLYHYKHVIDGDPDTFWISANNTAETIGIYFYKPVPYVYQLPSEVSSTGGTNRIEMEIQHMDWLNEFEIKVDYTWDNVASSNNYGRIIGWGVASSSGKGCLQISKGNAMNGYYAEIRGNDGTGIIEPYSWQSPSDVNWDTLVSNADPIEENTRYKMIIKNIPSSNELIVAIQKYDDFTSWENTLANKRLFLATTNLNNGCLLYTLTLPTIYSV